MPTPLDPLLEGILESGGFEQILNASALLGRAELTATSIRKRFPGIYLSTAQMLSRLANEAVKAGRDVMASALSQELDYSALPKIGAHGVPGARPGDVVVLSRVLGAGLGDEGEDVAVNIALPYGATPTAGEVIADIGGTASAIIEEYDDLDELSDAEVDQIIDEIIGVFVVQ